jgi:hypothetical protein
MSPSMLKEHEGNGICCLLACSKTKKQPSNQPTILIECVHASFHPLFYVLLKSRFTRFIAIRKIFCINIIKSYLIYLCFLNTPVTLYNAPVSPSLDGYHVCLHSGGPSFSSFPTYANYGFLNPFRPLFLELSALCYDDPAPLL